MADAFLNCTWWLQAETGSAEASRGVTKFFLLTNSTKILRPKIGVQNLIKIDPLLPTHTKHVFPVIPK